MGRRGLLQNEPNASTNTSRCGRTAACYLQLLQPAAAAVRAASPGTALSAPALAGGEIDLPWMQDFVAAGGLSWTDVVSVHPYFRPDRPDALGAQLEALSTLLRSSPGGSPHPVWITEFGDPTGSKGLSESRQAQDLVRATVIGLAKGAERVYWYDEIDHTPIAADTESNYGLYRLPSSFAPEAFEPKQAAIAAAVLVRKVRDLAATWYDEPVPGVRVVTFGRGPSAVKVVWALQAPVKVRLEGVGTVTRGTGAETAAGDRVVTIGAQPIYLQDGVHLVAP